MVPTGALQPGEVPIRALTCLPFGAATDSDISPEVDLVAGVHARIRVADVDG